VKPEVLTYFERVQGGDEFRANDEVLARFFPGGSLDEATVRRAAKGGDKDLAFLLMPSRERALAWTRPTGRWVREQSFTKAGTPSSPRRRTSTRRWRMAPPAGGGGRVYEDGRLLLDWAG
jgi:hypothetical protein